MRIVLHVLFWVVSGVLMVLFLGKTEGNYFSIVFTSLLLPIALIVAYIFNYWLFPKYLFQKQFYKFILFGLFVVVLALYLETLVVLWALIYLGSYSFNTMTPASYNIEQLAVILFFVVFLANLIYLIRRWTIKEKDNEAPIKFRVNRELILLSKDEILHIESLSDYVRIYTEKEVLTTREKISALEKRLPKTFIRVHRSFIVNTSKVQSITKTKVCIADKEIPVSRTYKDEVISKFNF